MSRSSSSRLSFTLLESVAEDEHDEEEEDEEDEGRKKMFRFSNGKLDPKGKMNKDLVKKGSSFSPSMDDEEQKISSNSRSSTSSIGSTTDIIPITSEDILDRDFDLIISEAKKEAIGAPGKKWPEVKNSLAILTRKSSYEKLPKSEERKEASTASFRSGVDQAVATGPIEKKPFISKPINAIAAGDFKPPPFVSMEKVKPDAEGLPKKFNKKNTILSATSMPDVKSGGPDISATSNIVIASTLHAAAQNKQNEWSEEREGQDNIPFSSNGISNLTGNSSVSAFKSNLAAKEATSSENILKSSQVEKGNAPGIPSDSTFKNNSDKLLSPDTEDMGLTHTFKDDEANSPSSSRYHLFGSVASPGKGKLLDKTYVVPEVTFHSPFDVYELPKTGDDKEKIQLAIQRIVDHFAVNEEMEVMDKTGKVMLEKAKNYYHSLEKAATALKFEPERLESVHSNYVQALFASYAFLVPTKCNSKGGNATHGKVNEGQEGSETLNLGFDSNHKRSETESTQESNGGDFKVESAKHAYNILIEALNTLSKCKPCAATWRPITKNLNRIKMSITQWPSIVKLNSNCILERIAKAITSQYVATPLCAIAFIDVVTAIFASAKSRASVILPSIAPILITECASKSTHTTKRAEYAINAMINNVCSQAALKSLLPLCKSENSSCRVAAGWFCSVAAAVSGPVIRHNHRLSASLLRMSKLLVDDVDSSVRNSGRHMLLSVSLCGLKFPKDAATPYTLSLDEEEFAHLEFDSRNMFAEYLNPSSNENHAPVIVVEEEEEITSSPIINIEKDTPVAPPKVKKSLKGLLSEHKSQIVKESNEKSKVNLKKVVEMAKKTKKVEENDQKEKGKQAPKKSSRGKKHPHKIFKTVKKTSVSEKILTVDKNFGIPKPHEEDMEQRAAFIGWSQECRAKTFTRLKYDDFMILVSNKLE